jgi:general secretion pathway protein K
MRNPERGAALLTVMLVFMLSTIVVAALLQRQEDDIRSARRYFDFVQASQYAMGAEIMARQMLYEDMELSPDEVDHLQEAWNMPEKVKFGDEGVDIAIRIEDLSGRFNLNNLYQKDAQFSNLFARLLAGLDIVLPKLLEDWKPEKEPVPMLFSEPTELLTQMMGVSDYRKLQPYITTLPISATSINVNTASDTLLRAASTNEFALNALLARRKAREHIGSADLLQSGIQPGSLLDVKSNFFQVYITVTLSGKEYIWRSICTRRRENKITTVRTIARAFNHEDNLSNP